MKWGFAGRAVALVALAIASLAFSVHAMALALLHDPFLTRPIGGGAHVSDVTSIDGHNLLAIGADTGEVRLYRDGRFVSTIARHAAPVSDVRFASSHVLTRDASGGLRSTNVRSALSTQRFDVSGAVDWLWVNAGRSVATSALPYAMQVAPLRLPAAIAGRRQGGAFRDCATCPEMIPLSGGTLMYGSPWTELGRQTNEGPRRLLSVQAFAVGRFEVTAREWRACAAAENACSAIAAEINDDDPVQTTLAGARIYVQWLSRSSAQSYALPTEEQWEFAARAGSTTPWPWGDTARDGCAYAALDWNTSCAFPRIPGVRRVGTLQPNAFGLYDMIGNLAELTESCADPTCSSAHVRGGSALDGAATARTAMRRPVGTSDANSGFRVVRVL